MKLFGLSVPTLLVIGLLAILAYHAWQRRNGVVRGPVHNPQPGAGAGAAG